MQRLTPARAGSLAAFMLALGMHGSALAGFAEGAVAYNSGNYPLALKETTPLASAGNADAQHLLGLMYYMGRGVERDYAKAFAWHQKAALQGKADAQYVIGAMYYTGNAVEQDRAQAVHWFRKAAVQGHGEAQYALALMYRYHVNGIPQDNVIAWMLWDLSAAAGNRNAAAQRDAVARQMTPAQLQEAKILSHAWKAGQPLPLKSRTGGAA